jgi:lambda family phage minor tail protein L
MSLVSVSQSPNPGEQISLFRLDATSVGGTVMFFCQGTIGGAPVIFGGVTYTPWDIDFDGMEINAGGVLPQPRMRVSNTNSYIQELVNSYGDIVGCEVRRVRTFKRFLDGQSEADPTAYTGPDVFRVEQRTDDNPVYIEWQLSAAIDQEGKMLPGRVVLRDTCTARYRYYAPTSGAAASDGFVYPTINPCPYTGTSYFDGQDQITTNANDVCSRLQSGCKCRFDSDQPLPFGGFPGAARVHA